MESHKSSEIVPHTPLRQTSKRPSEGIDPFARRKFPSEEHSSIVNEEERVRDQNQFKLCSLFFSLSLCISLFARHLTPASSA